MKHVYTTEYNSTSGDSAERIHLYALDGEEEYWKLDEMEDQNEITMQADISFIDDVNPMPGALYHRYRAKLTNEFMIITERIAYNI